jgi:protein-S-isoprenylcysteine O-methyltransferase Ste14
MASSKQLTYRRVFVYALGLLVLASASPRPFTYFLGLGMALLGVIIRIWGCGHLRKNQDVIQSGPYAHVKNPLYLGLFLIFSGALIAACNMDDRSRYLLVLLFPFVLGVFFVYYLPRKFAVEGDRLRRRFGEKFDRYDKAVPAFIPRLTPFQASTEKWNPRLVVENSEVSAAVWVLIGFAVVGTKLITDWSLLA